MDKLVLFNNATRDELLNVSSC